MVGMDEVGRGAWAGPLVVGAVVFPRGTRVEGLGIDDSKRLTGKRRLELEGLIKKKAMGWAVAEVSVGVINRLGIGRATKMGFRKAVAELRKKLAGQGVIDYVLLDAFYVERVAGLPVGNRLKVEGVKYRGKKRRVEKLLVGKGRQLAIVKGDQRSISIAAASIIAKVYRDKLMYRLSDRYTKYSWDSNVGYGTMKHCFAIQRYGLTRLHRRKFVETWIAKAKPPS